MSPPACLTPQKQLVSSPKPLLSTMNKVAQLSATISQGESSHNIDHNDAIVLSRCDLKTHICLAGFLAGIICLAKRPFQVGATYSVEAHTHLPELGWPLNECYGALVLKNSV